MTLVTVQRSPSAGSSPPASEYGGSHVSQEEEAAENNRSLSEYYFAVKGFGVLRTSSAPQDIQCHLQAMLNLLHPGHTLQMAVRLESVHGGRVRYLSVVSSVGRMDHLEAALIGTDLITEETVDRPRHRRRHKSPSRRRGVAGTSDDATSPAGLADTKEGPESSDSPGGTRLKGELSGIARDKKNKEFSGDCDRTNVGGEADDGASEGGEDCRGESDGSDGRTTVIISAANSDKSVVTGSKSGNLSDAGFIDVDTSGTSKSVNSESSNSPSDTPFLDVSSDGVTIASGDHTLSDSCDSSGNNNDDGGVSEGGKSKSEGGRVVKMTIGLVMALLADTHITLDGDGYMENKLKKAEERRLQGVAESSPLAAINAAKVTAKEMQKYIHSTDITEIKLSVEDVENLLDALVLDGRVKRYNTSVANTTTTPIETEVLNDEPSSSSGSGGVGGGTTSVKLWRALPDWAPTPKLLSVPCGVCPLIERCSNIGKITPETCAYLGDGLQDMVTSVGAPVGTAKG